MEIIEVTFDAWLRERVASRGASGPTLARQLAVPTSTVYRWLHGLAFPSDAMAGCLADALGTTVREVRGRLDRGIEKAHLLDDALPSI
ncbi:MAG TPA: helix-turn-helix transcriptional regulator [Chloroflexota bacterium]|nr:helix-turn-helix transcriptional regulator [Chloroflexota bacterium]